MVVGGSNAVTIVVVQRERFSTSRRSLESLLEHTDSGVPIIYVDSASPPALQDYLRTKSAEHGIRLIRSESYESPLHARNSAVPLIETEYVVFVDNDVLFSPGWLTAMLNTVAERGADVVTPLIQQGELEDRIVHTAGGLVEINEKDGVRRLREVQRFLGRPIDEVSDELSAAPTQMAEFHCILIRAALLEQLGLFDRDLIATSEHLDFSLAVQRANGSVWFTPESRVTYLRPPPVTEEDRLLYSLRWSRAWVEHSERHLFQKWGLEPDNRVMNFTEKHRRRAFGVTHERIRKVLGRRFANLIIKIMDWRESQRARRFQSAQVTALLEKGAGPVST